MYNKIAHFETLDDMAKWVVDHPNYDVKFQIHYAQAWDGDDANMYELRDGVMRDSYFTLSDSLGKSIMSIWKTRPAYRGSSRMVETGYKTLAGILKELGRTDIKDSLDKARKELLTQKKKIARNYIRRSICSMMEELGKYVDEHGAEIGVTTAMFGLPIELQDLLKDEE